VLIEGESGSGKSGIAAAVVRRTNDRGIPILFLDTRNYSSAVSAFGHLEQYVGVKIPLRDCLEKLGNQVGDCLLVIDQLDSTIGSPAYQVSIELLAAVAALENVKVVAVACVLDAAEYQAIKDLAFNAVVSTLLDKHRVTALLHEMDVGTASEAVLALSENLFYLGLVVELASSGVDISQLEGKVALLEKYQTALEETEGPEIIQGAIDLAYEKLSASRTDFALPLIQGRALQRLQNRSIIIAAGHGLYRFRHEQMLYYFYAQGAVKRDVPPVDILGRIAGRYAEEILVWLLRLYYYHRRSSELTDYLREALSGSAKVSFYEKAALLDEIQKWLEVTAYPNVLEVVLSALSADTSLEQYFFGHLAASENPGWFEPLRQSGFFDTPPEPIERAGESFYPEWPALWYLDAVAPRCPQEVVEVAERILTRNPFVRLNLVRAAQNMPPEYTARMIPLIVRWADEGMRVEEGVISLAMHLAQGNQWETALTLVDLLLSPQEEQVPEEAKQSPFFFPKAVSKVDEYIVQVFIEQSLAFFMEHRPLEVLHIVQRNLERAIEIEAHDSSSVWRPAIEPHEQNLGFGEIKELLVDAMVHALDTVVKKVPDQARTILEEYLEHRYSIFRRLGIHAIRLNANLWPDLLQQLYTDQQFLEDRAVYHEYWMLLQDTYGLLPTSLQKSFVERLLDRLPQGRGEDEILYRDQQYWVFRRLWALRDSLASDEHRRVLAELVSECGGEPDHPSFLSYSRFLVGSVSPKTLEELGQMSNEDILAELRKELSLDGFDEPTEEGLADVLQAAVMSDPQRFVSIAPELLASDISPIYTYHTLRGFREAWTGGKLFDWEPVLELCAQVSQTSEQATKSGEPPDMSPGYWMRTYATARSVVADLLEAGVVSGDNAIPQELLGQVRDILLVLADDPNPSPEYERKWGIEHPSGILSLALNVTRGKAVEALIQYALYVATISGQEQVAEDLSSAPGSRMEGLVRDKLTEKLDKRADPSLAVHSLFGKYLPNLHYLDQEWFVAHLEDIFPRQPEMSDYWEAAWDGYLFRGDFYGYLYGFLKPYYRYAIEQMTLGTQGKAGSELSRGRLTRHLAALYWRGVETLEGGDSLIPLFFNSAPAEIRARFITGLGVELREVKPSADSEEWLRAKILWETRVKAIGKIFEREGQFTGFTEELGAFARWVPLIPEDLGDFYPLIELAGLASEKGDTIRLLEFLSQVAEDHAPFVVSLLEKLVRQERGQWFWTAKYGTIRTILEAAIRSGDEQAKSCAVRIINLFGERGDERYRDLLKLI
jgi:hypothetical protein